ncbi:expressed unknown protein [Seminavis robusta]|uniref:Uncharacterized protein n=1 Tax=Seminavis robusta TaxID=568900 RepID=A0A9N8EDB1_9STRA|nr:expressed unknown protein [Seminavis robusta]|eukprot:Sro776_g200950.1 n/a (756) ;mRNA; f:39594-41861
MSTAAKAEKDSELQQARQLLVDVGVIEDEVAKIKAHVAAAKEVKPRSTQDVSSANGDDVKKTKEEENIRLEKEQGKALEKPTDPLSSALTKRNEAKGTLVKTRLPMPQSVTNAQNALPLQKAVLTVEKMGAIPAGAAASRGAGQAPTGRSAAANDSNHPTTAARIPMTNLTRTPVGRQQPPSEPGAIAILGDAGLDNEDLENAEHAMNNLSGTRPYSSGAFNADDHLVSAHLVPGEEDDPQEQSPRRQPSENEVYAVATVARDNSRLYVGGGIVAVVVALIVVLATTLSGNNKDNANTNNEERSNGMEAPYNVTQPTTYNVTVQVPPEPSYEESLQYGNTMKGPGNDNRFGAPLAMSDAGDILAVGARENRDVAVDSGMVRIFQAKNKTDDATNETKITWEQLGNALFGQTQGDEFAYSGMAISGDGTRLAVGAPYFDVVTTTTTFANGTTTPAVLEDAGTVQVFQLVDTTWSKIGQAMEGLQAGDVFGRAVAMSQDGSIVAGSSYESSENGFASGNVQVFRSREEDDSTVIGWDPMGQILVGRAELDRLGRALDMSADGMRFIAGATQFKGEGPGYAQVYGFNGTQWNQIGQDIVGETEQSVFGRDVAMNQDGSIVACGANLDQSNGLKGSGLARMYRLDTSSEQWVQMGQTILGAEEGDGLGVTVDLSADGMRVAIGAQQKKTSVGYVRVLDYDEASDIWIDAGQNNLTGAFHLDKFGSDVQLSTNGQFLAVGAIGADSNGDDSGHVQVFELS